MPTDGAIYCEQAYAQGKMLDSSGWSGFLPRTITPSDIDHVFDNAGRMVFTEFSSKTSDWGKLPVGQRLLYENLLKSSGGRHVAALCQHNTPKDKQIDTRKGVIAFSLMRCRDGSVHWTEPFGGDRWDKFVKSWFVQTATTVTYIEKQIPEFTTTEAF